MKLAYLILVHNQPMQLKRLILRLDSSNVQFFVHVDMKADIKQFEDIIQLHNVHFIQNRVKVYWGSYNIVQATLNGFEAIIQSAIEFDYITLLSGQDYPLTNNQAIQAFFKNNPGKAFMEFYPFETEWKEAIPRIHKYHLTNFPFSGSSKIEYLMNKLLPKRKSPVPFIFVGRSQWFSITLQHILYIQAYIIQHKNVKRFFEFTWGADEFVFQTILFNSPLKDHMINNNLRYIDWSAGQPSPKTFTIDDADHLINSGKLFARKFNMQTDPKILDFLDQHAGAS